MPAAAMIGAASCPDKKPINSLAASLATGQGAIHRLLSGSLVADCTQLAKLGFAPVVDTKTALRALLRD